MKYNWQRAYKERRILRWIRTKFLFACNTGIKNTMEEDLKQIRAEEDVFEDEVDGLDLDE